MPRPLRIEYPGAVYHITSRGNRGDSIYLSDKDRILFLHLLEKTIQRYNWICHAYCLMDNHYHLLVETVEANLSVGMRHLNGVYTQKFNITHDSSGHLFQGRYKSILVEKGNHLLELCRYIVANPVRAKICKHPSKWEWSSYVACAYGKEIPPYVTVDWILKQFSKKRKAAKKYYRKFVDEGLGNKKRPWSDIKHQMFLGSDDFIKEKTHFQYENEPSIIQHRQNSIVDRPELITLFSGLRRSQKARRNQLIYAAFNEYGYSMKEIGTCLGLHNSTISRIISILENQ